MERMLTIQEAELLVQEAFKVGMIQSGIEARDFAIFLSGEEVSNVLELGTSAGGMMYLIDRVVSPGYRISMDREWNDRDPKLDPGAEARFHKYVPNVVEIIGDIHARAARFRLTEILEDEKLDLIFQDSDHSEAGSMKDFYDYMQFLRPGGLFAFHDVRNGHGTQATYDQISMGYDHVEFAEAANLFGIGVLRIP